MEKPTDGLATIYRVLYNLGGKVQLIFQRSTCVVLGAVSAVNTQGRAGLLRVSDGAENMPESLEFSHKSSESELLWNDVRRSGVW